MTRRTAAVLLLWPVLVTASACGTDPDVAGGPATTPAASLPPAPSAASPRTSTPSATTIEAGPLVELAVADGQVSGDTGRVEVPLGATVRLRVTSDVADEVHVHGVDEYVDLVPGQVAEASFVADVPGVFEVELHDAGTLLTRLQVQ